MKQLNNFITEKLKISSKNRYKYYPKYYPKSKYELRKILEERLAEDKDADLNNINVSQITDMGCYGFSFNRGLFENLDPHNIDISQWDVSKVTDMHSMFYECENFNSDLSHWDVSNVENMAFMFDGCKNFNSDLSNWNVSNVTNILTMFSGCENFNCDLNNWDVSNVTDMRWMFSGCTSLKNKPSWY